MGKILGYQGFAATLFGDYPEQDERVATATLTLAQQEQLTRLCEAVLEAYTFSAGINGAKTQLYRFRSEAVVRRYFGLSIDAQPAEEICRAHSVSRTVLREILLRAYRIMRRDCYTLPLAEFFVEAGIHEAAPAPVRVAPTLETLNLTRYTLHRLYGAGIYTIEDLTQKNERYLLSLERFGKKSVSEIKEILEEIGLGLSD